MTNDDLLEAQLARSVREHAQTQYGHTPAMDSLWSRLAPQLTPAPRSATSWWQRVFSFSHVQRPVQKTRLFSLRYKIVLVLLSLLLVGGGTAAATSTGVWNSLAEALHFQTTVPAATGGYYTQLHQVHTIGNVTFTLEEASANAKWVVVGVTIVQPVDKSSYTLGSVTLTIKGTAIQLHEMVGDHTPVELQGGMRGDSYVSYFPVKDIPAGLKELNLHYAAPLLQSGQDTSQSIEFDFTLPTYSH